VDIQFMVLSPVASVDRAQLAQTGGDPRVQATVARDCGSETVEESLAAQ